MPWEPTSEGLRLRVRLTPGARAERIDGWTVQDDGVCVLKLRVTAPASEGRANAALVRCLSRQLKLPKTDVVLLAGARDRRKTILLRGDAAALGQQLIARVGQPPVAGPTPECDAT